MESCTKLQFFIRLETFEGIRNNEEFNRSIGRSLILKNIFKIKKPQLSSRFSLYKLRNSSFTIDHSQLYLAL